MPSRLFRHIPWATLRFRLTVWNTLVVLLIMLVTLLAVKVGAKAALYREADAVLRGERLRTVVQGLVTDLSRMVLRRTVTEPLANAFSGFLGGGAGGSFDLGKALSTGFGLFGGGGGLKAADGAVLDRMGVVPFARGGVVDRPVLFPFARGVGLMGEAGPEAIMPLRRTRDGRLGVEANGGGAVSVTVNITSPDAEGWLARQIRHSDGHSDLPITSLSWSASVEGEDHGHRVLGHRFGRVRRARVRP